MEESKRKKNSVAGAGFLILKKDTLHLKNPKMLALIRDDGLFDIPKGTMDITRRRYRQLKENASKNAQL